MRVAVALCVGLAVFGGLTVVSSTLEKATVVVAAHPLRRGDVIGPGDVEMVEVPASSALQNAFADVRQLQGKVVQNELEEGQPLFPGNARDSPVAPQGNTVLAVRVSSDAGALIVGDKVTVAAAGECPADAERGDFRKLDGGNVPESDDGGDGMLQDGTSGNAADGVAQDDADRPTEELEGLCVLARDAMVTEPARDSEDGMPGDLLSLAMRPREAVNVMRMQEGAALIAVQ